MLPGVGEAVDVPFHGPVGPVGSVHWIADDELAEIDIGHIAHPNVHGLGEEFHRLGIISLERRDLLDQGIIVGVLPARGCPPDRRRFTRGAEVLAGIDREHEEGIHPQDTTGAFATQGLFLFTGLGRGA